jgi:hypothetical protein
MDTGYQVANSVGVITRGWSTRRPAAFALVAQAPEFAMRRYSKSSVERREGRHAQGEARHPEKGSSKKVKSRKQAIAIGPRRRGARGKKVLSKKKK